MLRKHLHETYIVSEQEFVNNYDYLLKANDNAQKTITIKKCNKIVAVVFTSHTFQQVDSEIEKLEADHQADQFKIKQLKKQNEILKARCQLQDNLKKDDFPFK